MKPQSKPDVTDGPQTPPAVRCSDVVGRLERHIAQMASHQKERQAGTLLIDALAELKRLHIICGSKECELCKQLVPYVQQYVSTDKTQPLCRTCWEEYEAKPPNRQAQRCGPVKGTMPSEESMNIKVKMTPANKEARAAFDAACGSAAARSEAMTKWMEEVTALLCFQPEVPLKHKEDLCAALNEYKQVLHAIEITEPQNS